MTPFSIPARTADAPLGSEFGQELGSQYIGPQYETLVLNQLRAGNVPAFMRELVSVDVSFGEHTGKIGVSPDYLCVGTDEDYLRLPMSPITASTVARFYDALLPTPAMVDAIWRSSSVQLTPIFMAPTKEMVSAAYIRKHNGLIQDQLSMVPFSLGQLLVGQKKDVVICRDLPKGRVAIYGWHFPDGHHQQPLFTGHNDRYADYSHGIRLISPTMEVDGMLRTVASILSDPELCGLISGEGVVTSSYP